MRAAVAVIVVVEMGDAELLRCIGLAAAYLFNPTAFLYVLSMPSLTPHSQSLFYSFFVIIWTHPFLVLVRAWKQTRQ
jgi:hypothetical protein